MQEGNHAGGGQLFVRSLCGYLEWGGAGQEGAEGRAVDRLVRPWGTWPSLYSGGPVFVESSRECANVGRGWVGVMGW